jgi:hypothetical protein
MMRENDLQITVVENFMFNIVLKSLISGNWIETFVEVNITEGYYSV